PRGLPWPSLYPTMMVPHFDREIYRNVNLNATASEHSSGLDLPFEDITTMRFFFNLGLQQCRIVLHSQLHDLILNKSPQKQNPEMQSEAYSQSNSPCMGVNNLSWCTEKLHDYGSLAHPKLLYTNLH
ncbi:scd-1, partial [Pristionchus pacificus]|uniref:Uncharacterized protein n=1 Tax=Pristionchus pacificus TaxID=54126 RepID=A0A2A6D2M0_PRIPA